MALIMENCVSPPPLKSQTKIQFSNYNINFDGICWNMLAIANNNQF